MAAGESHPRALAEPYRNVSAHTAPITQPTAGPQVASAGTTVVLAGQADGASGWLVMRKYELTANLILASPIILALGTFVLLSWPLNAMIMGGLYLCGLCDLIYAKQPLWRHHVFNSFGPTTSQSGDRGVLSRLQADYVRRDPERGRRDTTLHSDCSGLSNVLRETIL